MGCGLVPPRPLRAWFRSQSLDALPSREKEEPSDRCASHTTAVLHRERRCAAAPTTRLAQCMPGDGSAARPTSRAEQPPGGSLQLPWRWARTDDAISKPEPPARPLTGFRSLPTRDVRALATVAVVPGDVAATVDHPAHGLDAEVAVAHRPVAGQLRRAALHVEAIVVSLPWRRCASARCGRPSRSPENPSPPLLLTRFRRTTLSAPPRRGLGIPRADTRAAGVGDDVVGDHVAVSLLDPDAVAASGDAVSTDHVPDSRPQCDPAAVCVQSVALDL